MNDKASKALAERGFVATGPISGDPDVLAVHGESALDLPSRRFAAKLEKRSKNRKALMQWVAGALIEGIDFGRFHRRWPRGKKAGIECTRGEHCDDDWHFTKPSLQKPGSEKIAGMLGLTASWPSLRDYEATAIAGKRIQSIVLRCLLLNGSGQVVGEGVGARRVTEFEDLNKAFKMAKKSALIDAVLVTAGLSEVFTQDLDEYRGGEQGDLVDDAELCPIGPWKNRPLRDLTDGQLKTVLDLSDDEACREHIKVLLAERASGGEVRPDESSAPIDREFTLDASAVALRGASSLEALERVWEHLPERFKKALAVLKDERKEELS